MNCRPGDLALIVRSRFGCNLGRIVQVLRAARPCPHASGAVWTVRSAGRPLACQMWLGDIEVVGQVEPRMECDIDDADLRPIRGHGHGCSASGRREMA